jgi:FkbM family methyltransferase
LASVFSEIAFPFFSDAGTKNLNPMKRYFRNLIEHFPHAAAESLRLFGWKGLYLAVCAYALRFMPFPVSLPGFGKLTTWSEAVNFVDNFCEGELRFEAVESALHLALQPIIVDIGINVGITCRWWPTLADKCQVVGIDMMEESIAFASERMRLCGRAGQWTGIVGGVGSSPGIIRLSFSDPLSGLNSLANSSGTTERTIQISPLDRLLENHTFSEVFLLKLDIEGSAGEALSGAAKTLRKTRFVVVETHHPEETRLASECLIEAGFVLEHVKGRTMWWQRR